METLVKHILLVALSLTLILRSTLCFAQTPASKVSLLSDDPRLSKKVITLKTRIKLRDLLKQWSEQTQVTISCPKGMPEEDTELAVYFDGVPLRNAMSALYGLMSWKRYEWKWVREGEELKWSYQFAPPKGYRQLAKSLREEVMKLFEEHFDKLIAFAFLSETERKENIVSLANAFLQDKPSDLVSKPEYLTNVISTSPELRSWGGLRLFSLALNASQREEVIRGKSEITISYKDLSAEAKTSFEDLYHKIWFEAQGENKVPESAKVSLEKVMLADNMMIPSLYLYIGLNRVVLGGGVTINKGIKRRIYNKWLLPGEQQNHKFDNEKTLNPDPSLAIVPNQTMYERHLMEFARAYPVPLLCRLPYRVGESESKLNPYSLSASQFVNALNGFWGKQMGKWRNGVFILTPNAWFWEETEKPDLQMIAEIEKSIQLQGFLPVVLLQKVALKLSVEQCEYLAEEYPVLRACQAIKGFMKTGEGADFLSESGVMLNEGDLNSIYDVPGAEQFLPRLTPGKSLSLRLRDVCLDSKRVELIGMKLIEAKKRGGILHELTCEYRVEDEITWKPLWSEPNPGKKRDKSVKNND